MIRGYFRAFVGGRRPYVAARLSVAGIERTIHWLVDTGADMTVLSPGDTETMQLDLRSLPRRTAAGVGGAAETALLPATVSLDDSPIDILLSVLLPTDPEQYSSLQAVPSLLGRDVLAPFGLYIEERRGLVLLFEPEEIDELPFA
jgi:predicted aspartyl protease